MTVDLSLVISLFSLLVAVGVGYNQVKSDTKINSINLDAANFNAVFQKHLLFELPKAVRYVHYDINNRLTDVDKLIEELNIICQDALYYKYTKESFYTTLVNECQYFEDYLVKNADITVFNTKEKKIECDDKRRKYLTNIYKICANAYMGD